jgi:tRNA pseudouridine38-40 synthase
MRQGAQYLLGNHDFSSFRGAGCQALSPVKTLDKLDIDEVGDEIIFTVEARSFIYHQVRNMVGTLSQVGSGKLQPEDVKRILEACDRTVAGKRAEAEGLTLVKIEYLE